MTKLEKKCYKIITKRLIRCNTLGNTAYYGVELKYNSVVLYITQKTIIFVAI